jgi:hypothetical protein
LLNACSEIAVVFRDNTVAKLETSNIFGDVQLQLDVEADNIVEKVRLFLFSILEPMKVFVDLLVKKDLYIHKLEMVTILLHLTLLMEVQS